MTNGISEHFPINFAFEQAAHQPWFVPGRIQRVSFKGELAPIGRYARDRRFNTTAQTCVPSSILKFRIADGADTIASDSLVPRPLTCDFIQNIVDCANHDFRVFKWHIVMTVFCPD